MSPSGGLRGRRGSILGTAVLLYSSEGGLSFFAGIRLLFGELDALTPPDCSGAMRPRGLWGRCFVKLRKAPTGLSKVTFLSFCEVPHNAYMYNGR